MKLRNKKTGEIGEFTYFADKVYVLVNNELKTNLNYTSLAELNEEWEDYEEPKTFWAISWAGEPEEYDAKKTPQELKEMAKEIGNYFDTREEAEKAVEKLKAWKRLKDKGFRFEGWEDSPAEDDFDMIWFTMKAKVWDVETQEALNLLFGGEE